jgi:hypothetical protein
MSCVSFTWLQLLVGGAIAGAAGAVTEIIWDECRAWKRRKG